MRSREYSALWSRLPEVEKIVDFISHQNGYPAAYALPDYDEAGNGNDAALGSDLGGGAPVKYDPLFADIARDAVSSGQISTSYIQRNYEVGFNRAGRIMTQLERAGIVGPQVGAKQREIKFYDLRRSKPSFRTSVYSKIPCDEKNDNHIAACVRMR